MNGILPACGSAVRMGGIPKMLLPVPGGTLMSVMVNRMRRCTTSVHVGSTGLTFDILSALYGQDVVMHRFVPTATMTQTVMNLQWYTEQRSVFFAMPDTWFDDDDAFLKLYGPLLDGAMVAVGVFRAREDQHTEGGMCVLDENVVTRIVDKSPERASDWIWGVLAWTPDFDVYLNERDPHVGYGVQRAIEHGAPVRAVKMKGEYFDCGTTERYFKLIRHLGG